MREYFADLLRVLSDSLMSVDEEVFKRLVNDGLLTLKAGKRIIVSGLGKNVPICDKFVGTMLSLGMDGGGITHKLCRSW